ncbi:hypothetical protein N7465_001199 [Penicillium sp. CMV-2018d]|nr:hypothetical protein N7465_001199 [Penicillium sp. CMV-2018d]
MIPSNTSHLGHLTANSGSKGNRTQACGSLRGQPCKFDIALNYCTTRLSAMSTWRCSHRFESMQLCEQRLASELSKKRNTRPIGTISDEHLEMLTRI